LVLSAAKPLQLLGSPGEQRPPLPGGVIAPFGAGFVSGRRRLVGTSGLCIIHVVYAPRSTGRLALHIGGYRQGIPIGVGNSQFGQYCRSRAFHLLGFAIIHVIIAEKMKKSVRHKMGKVIAKGNTHLVGFARHRVARKRQIAQQRPEGRLVLVAARKDRTSDPISCPGGRSTWLGSPVTIIFEPSPRRVRNIFICMEVVFCASSRMTTAFDSVRPRMKASGAISIMLGLLQAAVDLVRRHHIVERVVERAQIGIDLLLHVAGQEAEPLARLDRRTRQDHPGDVAALQQRCGIGDRQIGLAGTGRAGAEDQVRPVQRADIGVLRRRARVDGLLAGADLAKARRDFGSMVGRFSCASRPQSAMRKAPSTSPGCSCALLQALIQAVERGARLLAGRRRALDDHLLPRAAASTPSLLLDEGKVWSNWPNRSPTSRLSSNSRTICARSEA
jgi:hypothetical protein